MEHGKEEALQAQTCPRRQTLRARGAGAETGIDTIEQNKNFVQLRGGQNPLQGLQGTNMTDYRDEAPQILCDFLSYHENIKAYHRQHHHHHQHHPHLQHHHHHYHYKEGGR